ncbi:MAG: HAMP domain-containing histidine kinase [Oscillospiraceae bacterium]|nr:HAMP domain-containing histidine kinase [Oscillospiraceae bacterium]
MNFLKRKITRNIAAGIMTLFALCSAFIAADAVFTYSETETGRAGSLIYSKGHAEVSELQARLWLAANMYMQNTDGNGVIQGNEFFRNSLSSELKRAGVTDINGRMIVPETDNFWYTLNQSGRKVTNDSANLAAESDRDYMFRGRVSADCIEQTDYPDKSGYYVPEMHDCRCYTNTNGMYYYYCDGRGYAVYDYDVSGLDYYEDELGARIYLNSDGTTPVPDLFNETEYMSFDAEDPLSGADMNIRNKYNVELNLIPHSENIAAFEEYLVKCDGAEKEFVRQFAAALGFLGLSGIFAIYIMALGGYNEETGKFEMRARDSVYGELFVVTGLIMPLIFCAACSESLLDAAAEITRYNLGNFPVKAAAAFGAVTVYLIMIMSLDTLLNRIKCHKVTDTFFGTSMVKKAYHAAGNAFSGIWRNRDDALSVRFLMRFGQAVLAGVAALIIGIITDNPVIFIILALAVVIFYLYENLKDFRAIKELSSQITGMSQGDYTPRLAGQNSVTYEMTNKLNSISDGIQNAVEEQIRAERTKIELVTNVSHDLKTPLTSIVSYVDLLSKEELSPEARDYVTVLEQKTDRLKTIVSDVFDLAKATANTDVNLEKIDAVVLVNQVLADMEDRITKSEREVKTEINAETAFIEAEGKKMYRVLQNILDNALKYSMAGTRIFTRLDVNNGTVRFTVKNTASYEMNFTPDEITERFVRGDKSRTTEGSGLGLSIARSFTEACGGKFSVSVDGDVFAAEVGFNVIS